MNYSLGGNHSLNNRTSFRQVHNCNLKVLTAMLKAKQMTILDYIYTINTPTNCCSQRITQIPLLLWSVVVRYLSAPTCIDG